MDRARRAGAVPRRRRARRSASSLLAVLGAVMGPQWDPVPLADPLTVETDVDRDRVGARRCRPTRSARRCVTVQLDGDDGRGADQRAGRCARAAARRRVRARRRHRVATRPRSCSRPHALAASGIVDDGARQAARHVHDAAPRLRRDGRGLRRVGRACCRRAPASTRRGSASTPRARAPGSRPSWPRSDPSTSPSSCSSRRPWCRRASRPRSPSTPTCATPACPHGVFRAIPRAVGMSLPGGGFEYADFDVTPYQRQMTPARAHGLRHGRRVDADRPGRRAGAAGHGDRRQRRRHRPLLRGRQPRHPKVDGDVAADFLRDLSGWVLGLPATADAAPRIAGDQPTQDVPGRAGARAALVRRRRRGHRARCWSRWPSRARRSCWCSSRAGVEARRPGPTPRRRAGPRSHRFAARRARCDASLLRARARSSRSSALVWYLVAIARLALDYAAQRLGGQGGWVAVRAARHRRRRGRRAAAAAERRGAGRRGPLRARASCGRRSLSGRSSSARRAAGRARLLGGLPARDLSGRARRRRIAGSRCADLALR